MDKRKDRKSGKMSGRLGRLDGATIGYYRRVTHTLSEGFDSDEEKALFLRNVYKQVCDEALKVAQNQTVSGFLETLLHEASEVQLCRFLTALSKDWETACTDRFACYVTQTALTQCSKYIHNIDSSKQHEERKNVKSLDFLLDEIYTFLTGQLAFYMQHTYASHIIRTLLEVLSGTKVSDSVIRSRVSRKGKETNEQTETRKPRSEEILNKFFTLTDSVLEMSKIKDHAQNYLSNPVLQTVLLVLKGVNKKTCEKACKTLIERTEMFDDLQESLPKLFIHEIGSHLVEQMLAVMSEKLYTRMLNNVADSLVPLALHPTGNFVLQRFIIEAHTEEQFTSIYKVMIPDLEDILARNHTGILQKLAEGCLKFGTKQEKLVKVIMKAFHCFSPPERQLKVTKLLASFTTYDILYKEPDSDKEEEETIGKSVKGVLKEVDLHGSLLLQTLLHFGNPRLLVSGLLDMTNLELQTIACSSCGSHIIEAFLNSNTVGDKSRIQLYEMFKGSYVEMACNKHGSRAFDSLWNQASLKTRIHLATELAKHDHRLQSDKFGRFIWRNTCMNHFMYRRQDWNDIQTGSVRKRKLFKEILGTEGNEKDKTNDDERASDESEESEREEQEVALPGQPKSQNQPENLSELEVKTRGNKNRTKKRKLDKQSETNLHRKKRKNKQ